MEHRSHTVSMVTMMSVLLAFMAFILSLIVNVIPADLTTKIGITLLFVAVAYAFMIYNCLRMKGATNILFIMLCLSTMFYYGQHIVAVFNSQYLINKQNYSILDGKLPDNCIINASFLIIACMLLLTGAFLARRNAGDVQIVEDNKKPMLSLERKLTALRIVSVFFLLISFYPTIKYLSAQSVLSQTYGYLGRRNLEVESNYFQILGVSYFEVSLSQFFLPALYALMISAKSRIGKILTYALMIIYLIMYYMTGSRYNLLKMLVTIFLIRVIWIKPLEKRNLRKYILIGIAFILLFSAGSIIRNSGKGTINFNQIMDELSPAGTLWESGITFTTVSNLMDKCPSVIPFFYGKSWIGSILQCLPNALRFGFFEKYTLQTSSTFSHLYYNTSLFGYGSSFIAEGYYNFGVLIFPVMLLFGAFLRWIDEKLKLAKQNSSPYLFLVLVYVCGELAYGIRNDLSSVLRVTLSTVVIIVVTAYIVELMIYKKRSHRYIAGR